MILSIQTNKGGVGKSVSVAYISQLVSFLGKKCLAIDLDPQNNLSIMLGAFHEDSEEVIEGTALSDVRNIADIFIDRLTSAEDVRSCIHPTIVDNLDIIPSSPRHANTIAALLISPKQGNQNNILKKALDSIKDDYDYIFIDSAPTIDIFTINSIYTSNMVITPVDDSEFAFKGLRETLRLILRTKEQYGLNVNFGGAFLTRCERNTNSFKIFAEKYHSQLGNNMLHSAISKDIKIKEVASKSVPILAYCPNSNSVIDYAKLILELQILDSEAETLLKSCIQEEN